MVQDEQLSLPFAIDKGLDGDLSLSMKLRLGRLKFMEELNAQQATVDQAWQRVERAVSAFSPSPVVPARQASTCR
jgi:hypothetical protein